MSLTFVDAGFRRMMVDRRSGSVFAPYDGGADLFVPDIGELSYVRLELRDWLPAGE